MMVWPCVENLPGNIGAASLAGYTHGQALGGVTTSLTLLGPVLAWS